MGINTVDLGLRYRDNGAMYIINTIAPVFLIIGLGLMLRLGRFITDDLARSLNRLAYWVGLPCLIFYKAALTEHDFASAGKTFLVVFFATLSAVGSGYLAAFIMRIPVPSRGTFVQGCHRGNIAYIGLAIIIYSFSKAGGDLSADSARIEALAVLVLAMVVPLYNFISVTALLVSKHQLDKKIFARIFRGLITNPLIIASVGGLCYSFLFDSLPLAVGSSLKALGQMALPVALISIGASLVGERIVCENFKPAVAASMIKVFIAPLAGFAIARAMNLGHAEMSVAVIMLACPTAVASYVLTQEIGGNVPLSGRIVVISTMLSAVSLALAVGFFR